MVLLECQVCGFRDVWKEVDLCAWGLDWLARGFKGVEELSPACHDCESYQPHWARYFPDKHVLVWGD